MKLLHEMQGFDDEQFEKEYLNLAGLQHPNIVQLVGYCNETRREYVPYNGKTVLAEVTHRALCFEYMCNGSLDNCLSGIYDIVQFILVVCHHSYSLHFKYTLSFIATDEYNGHDWNTRYGIIKGICKGLKYLHEELERPFYHLDLKPGNVLLDENMVPKIADFGLSRFFGDDKTRVTNSCIGTR